MRKLLSTPLLLASTTIISSLLFSPSSIAEPSQTSIKQASKASVEYLCIERNGIPTTIVNTHKGTIELIAWKSDYFSGSGYTPDYRCQVISNRFQKYSDVKNLRYISTGVMNNQKVICVSEKSGNCKSNGLLITLQNNDDSEQVMRDLFNLAARKSSGSLTRTGNRRFKEMIDLDKFLAESSVIPNNTENTNGISGNSETVVPNPSVSPKNGNSVIENPFENF